MGTSPSTDAQHTEPSDAVNESDRASAARGKDAGRGPTPDEERVADEQAESVDTDAVAEPYKEMTETGANAKGEGRI